MTIQMKRQPRLPLTISVLMLLLIAPTWLAAQDVEYVLLATSKTSTMEKEMNHQAEEGYRFSQTMGGETSFGGSEVVVVMERPTDQSKRGSFRYILLATSKTSTMERELKAAGLEGYDYRGQSVFETAFGGQEVVVILEKDESLPSQLFFEYKLLATKKTSTMERELNEASIGNFELVGLTVGTTRFGGQELVSIMKRKR